MKNHSPLFLAMLPLLATSALTHAEETLTPVVVTATRTAQSADETLAAVTVVTREDIERSQAQSLTELLTGLPGVDITSNGGAGKTTSIFLRGTNPGHTLLLIDGMQIGSATTGTASPQYLPLAEIERIEIVRGPQSALYGSDAIGGVIQIFTRRGGEKTRANASIGAGQLQTRQIDAGVSGSSGNLRYSAQVSRLSSGNIDVQDAPADLDGYRNTAGSFNAAYKLSNTAGVETSLLRASGINEYDSTFQSTNLLESRFLQQSSNLRLFFKPADAWQVTLRGGESRDFSTEYSNGIEGNHFNTRRVSQSLQNDITIGTSNLLTVGVDQLTDNIATTADYAEKSRGNTGLFVQNQWQGGNHSITASARRDDNEAFGVHNTGRLAWGYRLDDDLRLMASYGTGFKAPSFNDLYYPGYGIATLKPEESQSGEIGLGKRMGDAHWSVRYFNNLITNLISFDAAIFGPNNIGNARIHGVEIEGGMQSRDWRLNASATLQDPRDADTGKYLQRRARQNVRFDLDRIGGKFTWGSTLQLEGDRYDDKNNTVLLRGYTLANLHAAYQWTHSLSLRAKVDNLFDENYTNVAGYNMPGRAGFVSLHYLTE
ncbi:MAG TPA: TonB-dependent receptor [Gammaproteobacteria bacterium]